MAKNDARPQGSAHAQEHVRAVATGSQMADGTQGVPASDLVPRRAGPESIDATLRRLVRNSHGRAVFFLVLTIAGMAALAATILLTNTWQVLLDYRPYGQEASEALKDLHEMDNRYSSYFSMENQLTYELGLIRNIAPELVPEIPKGGAEPPPRPTNVASSPETKVAKEAVEAMFRRIEQTQLYRFDDRPALDYNPSMFMYGNQHILVMDSLGKLFVREFRRLKESSYLALVDSEKYGMIQIYLGVEIDQQYIGTLSRITPHPAVAATEPPQVTEPPPSAAPKPSGAASEHGARDVATKSDPRTEGSPNTGTGGSSERLFELKYLPRGGVPALPMPVATQATGNPLEGISFRQLLLALSDEQQRVIYSAIALSSDRLQEALRNIRGQLSEADSQRLRIVNRLSSTQAVFLTMAIQRLLFTSVIVAMIWIFIRLAVQDWAFSRAVAMLQFSRTLIGDSAARDEIMKLYRELNTKTHVDVLDKRNDVFDRMVGVLDKLTGVQNHLASAISEIRASSPPPAKKTPEEDSAPQTK